jgi:hypothetical protein
VRRQKPRMSSVLVAREIRRPLSRPLSASTCRCSVEAGEQANVFGRPHVHPKFAEAPAAVPQRAWIEQEMRADDARVSSTRLLVAGRPSVDWHTSFRVRHSLGAADVPIFASCDGGAGWSSTNLRICPRQAAVGSERFHLGGSACWVILGRTRLRVGPNASRIVEIESLTILLGGMMRELCDGARAAAGWNLFLLVRDHGLLRLTAARGCTMFGSFPRLRRKGPWQKSLRAWMPTAKLASGGNLRSVTDRRIRPWVDESSEPLDGARPRGLPVAPTGKDEGGAACGDVGTTVRRRRWREWRWRRSWRSAYAYAFQARPSRRTPWPAASCNMLARPLRMSLER